MDILNIESVGLYKCNSLISKSDYARTSEAYEIELYNSDCEMIINGIEYKVGRGSIVLTRPGDERVNYSFYTCDAVHFTTQDPALKEFIEKIPIVINVYDYDYHYGFFKRIYKHYSSVDEVDLKFYITSDILYYLCFLRHESNGLNSLNGYISPSLYKCVNYIKNNYSEKISLDDVAGKSNVSVSYMHKLFKKTFNKTPLEYLTEIRIQKAKYLLIATNMKISDISEKTGFESSTNFYITFKAKVGMSPSSFRKTAPQTFL